MIKFTQEGLFSTFNHPLAQMVLTRYTKFMLETTRLYIRKFTPDDLDELIEMRLVAEVNKYLGGTRLQNPSAIAKRMQFYIDCHEKYGFGMSAMIWKETGEFFGWSGLQPLDGTDEIEVGYGMKQAFWRKGIGLECARAWLDFGFFQKGALPPTRNCAAYCGKDVPTSWGMAVGL